MTVETTTTFQGVMDSNGAPGQPIAAVDEESVAKDHGRIFEGLTGKDADGSGSDSTDNDPHVHGPDEPGNRLIWPQCTQHFGSGLGINDAATLPASSQFQDMPYVFSTGATHEQLNAWYFPTWISPAEAGQEQFFAIQMDGPVGFHPTLTVSLETWGTSAGTGLSADQRAYTVPTDVTGMRDVALIDTRGSGVVRMSPTRTRLFAKLTPAASGLHAVRVSMTLGNGNIPLCGFAGMHMLPYVPFNNSDKWTARPQLGSSNVAVVGDADNGDDYLPADDSMYAADDSMGMPLIINQINSGFLEEMATGLPVNGNATLTLPQGHDHSNPGSSPWYGKGIEFCLMSRGFGTISTNAALLGRFSAPQCQHACTTFAGVLRRQFYTPNFSGTKKLYCAAMVYKSAVKSERLEVKFTTTPSGGSPSSVTLQTGNNVGDPAGYQLLTDVTNVLDYKSAGKTLLEIEMRENTDAGNTDSLLGFCLWMDY